MKGLTVRDAARACGLSVSAVRYYEHAGMIPRVARDDAGRRVFAEADLGWLRYAVCLRSLGMGVADIVRYVDAANRAGGRREQLRLLATHLERMYAQRELLDEFIEIAEAKLAASRGEF